MKLRQKLAVVLASAMIITSVPVVTMAASTANPVKTQIVAKDGEFNATAKIDLKDPVGELTGQKLYFELEGSKFTTDAVVKISYKDVTKEVSVNKGDTKFSVALSDLAGENGLTATSNSGTIYIGFAAKLAGDTTQPLTLTGDEALLKIDASVTDALSDGTVKLAEKTEGKATVTFGSAKTFDGEGAIADITIKEPFAGVLGDKEIKIELQNSNYEFTGTGTVETSRGLSAGDVTVSTVSNDKQILIVKAKKTASPGDIVIKGITVKCKDKKPATEEISVNVYGDNVTEKEAVVAKVVEYGGAFKLSDKAVEVTAGQSKKVKVKLVENLADSFMRGKTVEFTLDNAELKAVPTGTTAIHKDGKSDKEIIGFEYTIPTDLTKALDKEFELEIVTKLDQAGKDVVVTASGRAIGADQELTVATINKAFEVSAESLVFQTGVKGQKGGALTVAETAKGQLATGKTFQIQLQDGAEFSDKPEIKVTSGDLVIDKVEVDSTTKSILNVTVKRASKTASTIEISNFQVKANRLLADGSYSVKLGNFSNNSDALGNGTLEVKDFLLVGEAAPAGTSTFTLNATTYTVNGKAYTMDVAPYIEAGRIMVPVKYVAAALGIDAANVIWDQATKTVTIFGDRTVQVTLGTNVALVNGVPLTMDGKVVMQSNRTFVPVAEIGKLLGIKATWNDATKSATFTN